MQHQLTRTNTSAVDKAMARLRAENGIATLGRVLTLVVMAEEGHSQRAVEAAIAASHEHPCRIIVHVAHEYEEENRLDAELFYGGEAGASELVILHGWGQSAQPTESLLSGLLLPDAPIVAWWPHALPDSASENSIGRIATRRITDSARAPEPWRALESLAASYAPGDTDLAWTRLTHWRSQLAAVLDELPESPTQRVVVEGSEKSPSVILLGTWLGEKLGADVEVAADPRPRGLFRVTLCREDGEVTISRPGTTVATLSQPDHRDQQIALKVRTLSECLAEELRRLDPDETFGAVLTEGLGSVNITWTQCQDAEEQINYDDVTEPFDA